MTRGLPIERARGLFAGLCLIPWLICGALTLRYGFDVPYWDQWWHVPLVEKAFDGSLSFTDLWGQLNEHRIFISNIVIVALARLTHWNLRCEHAVELLCATFAFLLIVKTMRNAEKARGGRGTLWAAPVIAVMIFSYNQWGIWMWGLHIVITLTAALAVATIYLLSAKELPWPRFLAACALAVATSLSFGSGVGIWGCGLGMLAVRWLLEGRQGAWRIAVWLGVAGAAMAIYFIGYESTSANEDAFYGIRHPLAFTTYILSYLGSPLFSFSAPLALVASVCGIAYFIAASLRLIRNAKDIPHTLYPFWGLAFMAASVAFLTALKQSHEGIAQALSSRYIIWPTLFWAGLTALLYLESLDGKKNPRRTAAALAICAVCGASSLYGAYRADERHDAFLIGRAALMSGENDADLRWLYPEPSFAKEGRKVLVKYGLTAFRD